MNELRHVIYINCLQLLTYVQTRQQNGNQEIIIADEVRSFARSGWRTVHEHHRGRQRTLGMIFGLILADVDDDKE